MHLLVVFFAFIFFSTVFVFAETIPEWAKALASLVQTMNATLNSHLETIESRLGSVESGIIEVKSQIVHGFQSMHTFGRRRVEAIKQASNNFYIQEYCQGAVTRHTVVYNNRVGELFCLHRTSSAIVVLYLLVQIGRYLSTIFWILVSLVDVQVALMALIFLLPRNRSLATKSLPTASEIW